METKAQIDTSKIILDFKDRLSRITSVNISVILKERLFYALDTSVYKGSIIVDYSSLQRNKFPFISIYEKRFSRVLIYDSSGTEYSVYKNDITKVREMNGLELNEEGLGEPLLPMIFDKFQKFEDWFFRDISRIKILNGNDSTFTIGYTGQDTSGLKFPPELEIEFYRENLLPKSIITKFTLSNDEIQFQSYEFIYGLTSEQVKIHQEANTRVINMSKVETNIDNTTKINRSVSYKVGDKINTMKLRDLDGKEVIISKLKKKYALLYFTYSSCKPCSESVSSVNKLADNFNDKLEVYAINPFDEKSQIEHYKNKFNVKFNTYKIDNLTLRNIGVKNFPYFILLNKENVIKYIFIGFTTNLYGDIAKFIE